MIEVKIESEMASFRKLIMQLSAKTEKDPLSLNGMLFLVTRRIANIAQKAVVKGYLTASGAQHSPGTMLTYRFGKAQGEHRKFRMAFPSAKPASRSGTLAKNVVAKRLYKGSMFGHKVEIDPAKRYHGFGGNGDPSDAGKPMWWVAAQLESPTPQVLTLPLTKRMQVYLMLLYRGQAGEVHHPARHITDRENIVVGRVITRRKPRPVWNKVFTELARATPQIASSSFSVQFQKAIDASRLPAAAASLSSGSSLERIFST